MSVIVALMGVELQQDKVVSECKPSETGIPAVECGVSGMACGRHVTGKFEVGDRTVTTTDRIIKATSKIMFQVTSTSLATKQ